MTSQRQTFQAVKGMNDILPPESRRWQEVEACARRVFGCYGYEEIRTPIAEPAELFRRSVGETTAIVEKEMYTFEDQGGKVLTLRPEGTASVVRAYIQAGASLADPMARFCYIGPMFRRERPQKGRQRQFHQIGCELLGSESPLADAEIIAMNDHFLREVGLRDITLEINSLGCTACRPAFHEALLAYLQGCRSELCGDCQRRIERNPLRFLDCKQEGCARFVKEAPKLCDYWCDACQEHFTAVKDALTCMGVVFTFNASIVRGLDYYVRTAFEFTTTKLGAQNAVAAGGRYDGLVQSLGGPDVPGVGCALGLERLLLLLHDGVKEFPLPESIFFAVMGKQAQTIALPIIQGLRAKGLRVEWDLDGRSLKAQMRRAGKLGAHAVCILGDQEIEAGVAQVKDMQTGEQRSVRIADLEGMSFRHD